MLDSMRIREVASKHPSPSVLNLLVLLFSSGIILVGQTFFSDGVDHV